MTRPVRPEVFDSDLRAALEQAGDHIENYGANLDAISNDIKAVERYLTDSGIRIYSYARLGYSEEFTDGDYDVGGFYKGDISRDVERVEWAPCEGADGRWRVMFRKFRRFGAIEIWDKFAVQGPTYTGNIQELERKPLIETSVEIRLRAHKHLGELVSAVGKLVEVSPLTDPASDDVPF